MKKLLTGIVVLALANLAFAVPAFDINGGAEVKIDQGAQVVIPVNISNAQGILGMNLYLETTGNFEIMDIVLETGTAWSGNVAGSSVYHQFKPMGSFPLPPSMGIGMITSNAAFNITNAPVAFVTVKAVGTVGEMGTLTTNAPNLDVSDLVDTAAELMGSTQGTVALSIVPEPVSALLLLAGLPLIRRRRA